jgi:glycine hydroxymethyltransferase
MNLTPREKDKLLVAMAAEVARKRLARGVKLNHPESIALITDTVVEGARDGRSVAEMMQAGAEVLTRDQCMEGVPVFAGIDGFTISHQFAVLAESFGGGQTASKKLRPNGFLACGIGLPVAALDSDMNGLRIGTPELVRWGMTSSDAGTLAQLIGRALHGEDIAQDVKDWRMNFNKLHFIHEN